MIRAGQRVRIKPEWQDEGDDSFVWHAVDSEEKGRVTIQAENVIPGGRFQPQQTVNVSMIEPVDGKQAVGPKQEPTCPHSATQHMGGECESCYAKRTGWRPGQPIQAAKAARMQMPLGKVTPMRDMQQRVLEGRRRIERQPKARLD